MRILCPVAPGPRRLMHATRACAAGSGPPVWMVARQGAVPMPAARCRRRIGARGPGASPAAADHPSQAASSPALRGQQAVRRRSACITRGGASNGSMQSAPHAPPPPTPLPAAPSCPAAPQVMQHIPEAFSNSAASPTPCWRDPATSKPRCLPAFYITGLFHAGAGSLSSKLLKHPSVVADACSNCQFWGEEGKAMGFYLGGWQSGATVTGGGTRPGLPLLRRGAHPHRSRFACACMGGGGARCPQDLDHGACRCSSCVGLFAPSSRPCVVGEQWWTDGRPVHPSACARLSLRADNMAGAAKRIMEAPADSPPLALMDNAASTFAFYWAAGGKAHR